jgi:electron transport complex protein RnfG
VENKMEKSNNSTFEMIKLGLILALYAAISCVVLAIVNNVTAPKIQQNQITKANNAMKKVLAADTFEQITDFEPSSNGTIKIEDMYLAKKDGKVIGATCQVSGPTYEQATIIVGLDKKGTVTGVEFLKITDSPGFGLKANDPTFIMPNGKTFYGQFEGKKAADGFTAGRNFDAISGATITSVGIANLINEATSSMLKYLGDHNYE